MEKQVCSLITLQSFFTSLAIGRNIINDVNDKKEMDFFLIFYQYMVRETIKMFGMDSVQHKISRDHGITDIGPEEMHNLYNMAMEYVTEKKDAYEKINPDNML